RGQHGGRGGDYGDAVRGEAGMQECPGHRCGHPRDALTRQKLAHDCFSHSVASRRRVSRSNCGMTLESPMIVMKLASPPHRGTTCTCRCSASDPPADAPKFRPTLNPCGRDTFL